MINDKFINSLKYMNEETILDQIKNGKHNIIETQILKKRLNYLFNKKKQEDKEYYLINKISYLENIIKNQQIEINILKLKVKENVNNDLTNKLDRIKFLINKNK